MKKFFVMITSACIVFAMPAAAAQKTDECGPPCDLYKRALPRKVRPVSGPLVCVNFTLPKYGAKVTLQVTRGGKRIVEDSKEVHGREGQFCYPRATWMRLGTVPDKVYLCSEHSVILTGTQIDRILSGRGEKAQAFACLRGIVGCGGRDAVSLAASQLGN